MLKCYLNKDLDMSSIIDNIRKSFEASKDKHPSSTSSPPATPTKKRSKVHAQKEKGGDSSRKFFIHVECKGILRVQ